MHGAMEHPCLDPARGRLREWRPGAWQVSWLAAGCVLLVTASETFGTDAAVRPPEPGGGPAAVMIDAATCGTGAAAAEREPHSVVHGSGDAKSGTSRSGAWSCHQWSADEGVHGASRSLATLRNVRDVRPAEAALVPADGARERPLPD